MTSLPETEEDPDIHICTLEITLMGMKNSRGWSKEYSSVKQLKEECCNQVVITNKSTGNRSNNFE